MSFYANLSVQTQNMMLEGLYRRAFCLEVTPFSLI